MGPELLILGVIGVALILYALLGGADFGAGIWEFNSAFQASEEERALIQRAIGPVWEANHVWVLYALVLLLTAFPAAYAVILDSLRIPITLFLLGMVLRGSAYTFRAYGLGDDRTKRHWGLAYALSSAITMGCAAVKPCETLSRSWCSSLT